MKLLFLFFSLALLNDTGNWMTNFDEAKQLAKEKHRNILLSFSGSDWCGPCIRLKKEMFESKTFTDFSEKKLILVNADFPRNKKNKLSDQQLKHNEALAEKYNPKGKFPYTILLNEEGKVLKIWDGLPATNPDIFIQQLTKFTNAGN